MGILTQAADTYYAYRFLRLLTTPWKETDAFEQGVIDDNGKLLIKPSKFTTKEQKNSYTYFNRLVFNIKRLLEKAPGSNKLGSYIAALYLIREELGLSDSHVQSIAKKMNLELSENLTESWYVSKDSRLEVGTYTLTTDIASSLTGDIVGTSGSRVVVKESVLPIDYILDRPIYPVTHGITKQILYITPTDLMR
jgi:hypothetical protein